MKREMAEMVEQALAQQAGGQALPDILADFPEANGTLAGLLQAAAQLEALEPVAVPEAAVLAADRAAFLEAVEATRERAGTLAVQTGGEVGAAAVSPGAVVRLREWVDKQMALLRRGKGPQQKERTMFPVLAKAALVLMLAFGSIGGTVAVSADSLPGEPVYAVKLAVEQARLALSREPAGDAMLHLAYARERVQEMARMAGEGEAPDEATMNRLRLNLEQAVQLAQGLPEEKMVRLLAQVREVIRTQATVMAQVEAGQDEPVRLRLQAVQGMLWRIGQTIEAGLQDPQAVRQREGVGRPETAPEQPVMEPPRPVITPTGAVSGTHGYGPGQPGGNPDCVQTGTCEPAGMEYQHQHQQQGEPPAPGENRGNPDGGQECGDPCEPVGDQHQYGNGGEQPGPGGNGNPDTGGDGQQNQQGATNGDNGGDNGGNGDVSGGNSEDSGGNSDDSGGNSEDSGGNSEDSGGNNDDSGGNGREGGNGGGNGGK